MMFERTVIDTDGHEIGYVGPKYVGRADSSALCSAPGCFFESPTFPALGDGYRAYRRALKVLERHFERKHGTIHFDRSFPTRPERQQRRRLRRLSRRGAVRHLWRALLRR